MVMLSSRDPRNFLKRLHGQPHRCRSEAVGPQECGKVAGCYILHAWAVRITGPTFCV